MFDVQPSVEAAASYMFQVRLILASKQIALPVTVSPLMEDALASGCSASDCALKLTRAFPNIRADTVSDAFEVEYP